MDRQSVVSSNLNSIGFDPQTNTLEIEFNDNSVYHYFGVPEQVYLALLGASSHGKYFHANIRDRYPTKKIN